MSFWPTNQIDRSSREPQEDSINCGATALTVADELIWAMSQAAQIPGWSLGLEVLQNPFKVFGVDIGQVWS